MLPFLSFFLSFILQTTIYYKIIKTTRISVFYLTNEMQLIHCSLLLSALYMFRAAFRPSSGAYKTVCVALGIVMLSCCLPLVWVGWKWYCSNPPTPAVDSRKA